MHPLDVNAHTFLPSSYNPNVCCVHSRLIPLWLVHVSCGKSYSMLIWAWQCYSNANLQRGGGRLAVPFMLCHFFLLFYWNMYWALLYPGNKYFLFISILLASSFCVKKIIFMSSIIYIACHSFPFPLSILRWLAVKLTHSSLPLPPQITI